MSTEMLWFTCFLFGIEVVITKLESGESIPWVSALDSCRKYITNLILALICIQVVLGSSVILFISGLVMIYS